MNLGSGSRRQTILAGVMGVLALGACIYIYEEMFATGDSTPSANPAPAATSAPEAPGGTAGTGAGSGKAAKTLSTSAALDPSLHMEAMLVTESVEYTGNGRNIFSANSAPPMIPNAIAPPRPMPSAPVQPPQPVVQQAQPPPPIPLKYFGVETASNGARQAFLLHDDDVYMAAAGDVVMRRYRVISVEPKSLQMEDMQNNDKQTLPLLAE